jgi:hypothetical protein
MSSLGVRESADFIASVAAHVRLGDDSSFSNAATQIGRLVNAWQPSSWSDSPLHPRSLDPSAKASWIFLIDTLNFAFWTPPGGPPFTVTYQDRAWTGYRSLCAAILRAIDEKKPILDSSFWARSSAADWAGIFRSDTSTPISLLERRVAVISEAGRFLIEKFNGSTYQMVTSIANSAIRLVDLIRSNLESYRDQCEFKGKTVYFLKRAQILAADLHFGLLDSSDPVCRFDDIDQITMFADYRVPQVLNYLGLLVYSGFLVEELKNRPHFPAGSELECEIRGLSIAAVEKLKKYIGGSAISVLIDYALWDFAKANAELMDHIPVHKTEGIFY